MSKQMKVAANLQQDFSDTEKEMARLNIGIDLASLATVQDVQAEATERETAIRDLGEAKQDRLTAGNNITIDSDGVISSSGGTGYSVGRNLHLNQNNQIQTNLPGGRFIAPTSASSNFSILQGADFASAFKLACRHNANGTYELGLSYTASGLSAPITFLGTEVVIAIDGSLSIHPAAYINDATYNTPHRFGNSEGTAFDPSLHKAIAYNGIADIGTLCDFKMAIWNDDGTVRIAFTAIEVGRVGSTL